MGAFIPDYFLYSGESPFAPDNIFKLINTMKGYLFFNQELSEKMVGFLELANNYLSDQNFQIKVMKNKIHFQDKELMNIKRKMRETQKKQKYLAVIGIGFFLTMIVDKPIFYKNIMAVINALVDKPTFFNNLLGAITHFFGS